MVAFADVGRERRRTTHVPRQCRESQCGETW
jgi:hypothetical protein